MTEDMATPTGAPTAFDKWQTVAVAIFIALVGYTVMVSFPVLATALVEKAGFSEVEVGRIWGADMFGFSDFGISGQPTYSNAGCSITLVQDNISFMKAAERRQSLAWGASPREKEPINGKPQRGDRTVASGPTIVLTNICRPSGACSDCSSVRR